MPEHRPLIFIPTYNERENVSKLCDEILTLGLELDILIVDDNSPDGTGEVIDGLAKKHSNIFAHHRAGKLGIGSAHRAGIQWARDHGYTKLVTMDCDFTHPPASIPELLALAESSGADVVVGSRYLKSNSLDGWNPMRRFLTHTGHLLTKHLLGMSQDATGGFRFYRLDRVPAGIFDLVSANGYGFMFESLYVIFLNGHSIAELPISLPPRTYGSSKMDFREVRRSLNLLTSLYATTTLNRERLILGEALSDDAVSSAKDNQGWDEYWDNHDQGGRLLYDVIAAVYRKLIIKRSLNLFVREHFAPHSAILHAGCGSGQVDTEISEYVSITALDISLNALGLYSKVNPKNKVVHGSIFEMPLTAGSFDGIYNLGVMEHFTEAEIHKILLEFFRVLKPGGQLLIFWPPEFGASVVFLKGVKWYLENVLGKSGVKIHPDEITRVQSKSHVNELFESAGFTSEHYYFGPRDLFTYSVIVARKPAA